MNVWIQNPFDNLPVEGYRKQRFWLMAEAFARAGHQVTLWTGDFNHMTKARRSCTVQVDSPVGLRLILTLPYRKNVGLERVRSHRAYAQEWLRMAAVPDLPRPEVIIASTPTISGAEAAIVLGRRFGAKVIVDVMDAWPETFERLAPQSLRVLARILLSSLRRRARRVYREADLVTGVCERYRSLTARNDYYLSYHGLERGERTLPRRNEPTDHLRLVYAGNLGMTYDLGTVIRGVKELGASLDVAGKGQGEAKWRRMVLELGMENQVTFHGYLGEKALAELLRSCDIGVVPMPEDSFVGVPYKFADYADAGLLIASSLGGESEGLLKKHRCGAAYETGNVASFVAAVRSLGRTAESDIAGLSKEFDATRIYDAYVRRVLTESEESALRKNV